ncbi:DNA repair protein RadA, partial [Burkholderia pseudomallei]
VVRSGGEPGSGMPTLRRLPLAPNARQRPALYISGEESGAQIALRAQRLALREGGASAADLKLLAEIQLETSQAPIDAERPDV